MNKTLHLIAQRNQLSGIYRKRSECCKLCGLITTMIDQSRIGEYVDDQERFNYILKYGHNEDHYVSCVPMVDPAVKSTEKLIHINTMNGV